MKWAAAGGKSLLLGPPYAAGGYACIPGPEFDLKPTGTMTNGNLISGSEAKLMSKYTWGNK